MNLIFTSSLSVGIQQLKENLFNELSHDVINLRERALILEVICELCNEISIELERCNHDILSVLAMDMIFWRKRPKYLNTSLNHYDQFFHQQLYSILPFNQSCMNMCIVNTLDGNIPYFYQRQPRPDITTQRVQVNELNGRGFKVGEYCYLVNRDWYSHWYNKCTEPSSNNDLEEIGTIRNELPDSVSIQEVVFCQPNLFTEVSESVWLLLLSWYGLSHRSLAFKRQILSCKDDRIELENALIHISCYSSPEANRFEVLAFRYEEAMESVLRKLCVVFRIQNKSQIIIYTRYNNWSNWTIISEDIISARDLYENKLELLILKKTNSDWPLSILPIW